MPKYAQLVMGPAGSGKSTYCATVQEYFEAAGRSVAHIVNFDPAADKLRYEPAFDIRECISIDDVVEAEDLGPNGGLVQAMEYLVEEGTDWLEDRLAEFSDDDYLVFDCPGQIELYSHVSAIKVLVEILRRNDFQVCGVYAIDCMFATEASKLVAGMLSALSAMALLEIPHVNVLTKCDLMKTRLSEDLDVYGIINNLSEGMDPRYRKLNEAFGRVLDEFSLVSFVELDISDEASIENVIVTINNAVHYGEDLEGTSPRSPREIEDDVDSS
jgi:GTPase SAR1 family protein